MRRRDLLRTVAALGAGSVIGRWPHTTTASAQIASSGAEGETLDSRLSSSIQRHNVPGASVALIRAGQLQVAAAGVTNVTTGVTVTPETLLHIGSITKVLNATLVMQLVDEGRVDLAAPLKRYLPDFQVADRDATERITVEMLLNHTCGIDGEYFSSAGPDAERIEDAIASIARRGQIHAPGTDLSYCNAGAVLAGYLAQRVLGRSWYTLIEERIFEPLGLQHAVVQPADALLHRAAVGHFINPNGANTRTSSAFLNPALAPAGTTAMLAAKDLATFAFAHVNDGEAMNGRRLLSAASARRMRRQSGAWSGVGGAGFGLGWMTIDRDVVGHDGGGPGVAAWLFADAASKTVAAVLTNAAHGGAVIGDITRPLYQAAGAKPFQTDALEREKTATGTRVDPRGYVGQYESTALAFRVIPYGDGVAYQERPKMRLYETDNLEESPPDPLRPMGDGHFTSARRFMTFLNPDAAGRAQHLASRLRLFKRTG